MDQAYAYEDLIQDAHAECFAKHCKEHDDRVRREAVAAIIAEVTARRDRAAKRRDDIAYGQEKALDDLLDWLGDWKRGG